ncbi:hypothetical protein [Cognatiyoonia sp. IB215182]|uniref:hypothetical protein n=1 Tax=Cognatiyoonia sp. IB215182 TaxID=3097353 RepID=UPI0039B769B8
MQIRGGTPVGMMRDLCPISAAAVTYLRLWCGGPDQQSQVWNALASALGTARGRRALQAFEALFGICAAHGRRPLIRHAPQCKCVGSDEACFANFIATAADGAREDALLMATLLVRTDMAPVLTSLATDFGLALKRIDFAARPEMPESRPLHTTLH